MDSKYKFKNVDEVYIVGLKSDLKARLKGEDALEDDPRAGS